MNPLKNQLHNDQINYIIFVYARDGEVKCMNYYESIHFAAQMVREGWKHTATISPARWIEALANGKKTTDSMRDFVNELHTGP